MTYEELYIKACHLFDNNEITLGEFEEMIEPLKYEIPDQAKSNIEKFRTIDCGWK